MKSDQAAMARGVNNCIIQSQGKLITYEFFQIMGFFIFEIEPSNGALFPTMAFLVWKETFRS